MTRHEELIDEDIASELQKNTVFFKLFSLALDESNDTNDPAQLLIFIRGINDSFEITEEFDYGVPERKNAGTTYMAGPWSKLANVTMDGCQI